MLKRLTLLGLLGVLAAQLYPFVSPAQGQQRVELGMVKWHRDLESAKALAGKQNKPLFVQFQEVPG